MKPVNVNQVDNMGFMNPEKFIRSKSFFKITQRTTGKNFFFIQEVKFCITALRFQPYNIFHLYKSYAISRSECKRFI